MTKTRQITQQEYERNELQHALRHEQEINQAPLNEHKAAQRDFARAMSDPSRVARLAELLLKGAYGYGEMLLTQQPTKRINRVAMLIQLVGVFAGQCPRRMTIVAWRQLTKKEQRALQKTLEKVLAEHDDDVRDDDVRDD